MSKAIQRSYFHYIEVLSYWQGHINSTQLQKYYGISRSTASKLLNDYKTETNNLVYCVRSKAFLPQTNFSHQYSEGKIHEYQHLYFEEKYLYPKCFSLLETAERELKVEHIRQILKAINAKRRLDIGYASLSSPSYEERIISPHHLIYDGMRWHVRAYCEKNKDFRDFVLSRFSNVFNDEGVAKKSTEHDEKWNTFIELEIEPDPRLSKAQQRIIEMDYAMINGYLILNVRVAQLLYILKRYNLDQYNSLPEAQQIILSQKSRKLVNVHMPK